MKKNTKVKVKDGVFKNLEGTIVDMCEGFETYLVQLDENNAVHINKSLVEPLNDEFEITTFDGTKVPFEVKDDKIVFFGDCEYPTLKHISLKENAEIIYHMNVNNTIDEDLKNLTELRKVVDKHLKGLMVKCVKNFEIPPHLKDVLGVDSLDDLAKGIVNSIVDGNCDMPNKASMKAIKVDKDSVEGKKLLSLLNKLSN